MRSSLVIAIGVSLSTPAFAQRVDTLPAAAWRSDAEFVSVTAVRELDSGAVIVIDMGGDGIYLVSPDGSSARVVARKGAGPGEVRQPMAAMRMLGDSTAIPDMGLRRVLVLDPLGVGARVIALPAGVSQMVFGARELLEGRWATYPTSWSATGERNGQIPIVQWDLLSGAIDTVGSLTRARPPGSSEDDRRQFPSGRVVPYMPNDVLVAGSADRFAVLRAADFRVEIFSRTGSLLGKGPPRVVSRVRVPDEERRLMPPGVIPEFKPPFTETGHVLDARGRVWVRRSRPSGVTWTLYDIFSPDGRFLRTYTLLDDARIVGSGARGIYVARSDDDGIQRLERHTIEP